MPTRSKVQALLPSFCGKMFDCDRDLVADLPAVLVGQRAPDDHAGAGVVEGLPLLGRHHVLRIDIAQAEGIGGEEDQLRVLLPHRAEPLLPHHLVDAGHALDLRQQAQRQRLGERHPRLGHEARGADEIGAGGKQHVDRLQQPEQHEGRHHRQQGQRGAGLLAEQVAQDESGLGHGDSPCSSDSAGRGGGLGLGVSPGVRRDARTGIATGPRLAPGDGANTARLRGGESRYRRHLLEQLALLQVQDALGVLGGLGIVRDHDDGLAVLAG